MSHAVIIKNAVKKYGDFTALNGVSLDTIKMGSIFLRPDIIFMQIVYFGTE